jgi:hypothetical protein
MRYCLVKSKWCERICERVSLMPFSDTHRLFFFVFSFSFAAVVAEPVKHRCPPSLKLATFRAGGK